MCDTPETICESWATHFEKLATPLECQNFDNKHRELVKSDIQCIERIVSETYMPIEKISDQEIKSSLSKLKTNEAADIINLTSEHFKFGGQALINYLLDIMNYIVCT